MRSGRSNHTYVKARELERGMVVQRQATSMSVPRDFTVIRVERAADLIEGLQRDVANAKTKPKLRDAAETLLDVLDAIEYEGREARLVWFVDQPRPARFASQDELRYVGRATVKA